MMYRKKKVSFTFSGGLYRMTDFVPAPGRSQYQLNLAREEGADGPIRGTASWLASGLRIQESQYAFVLQRNRR